MLQNQCMFITNEFEDVRTAIANGITIVALVDNADEFKYLNCVIMGVLLPPYEALSAEIDGDPTLASDIYFKFLFAKMDIIANLLAALYRGKRLLLYVPKDESMHFGFVGVLCAFMQQVFGIDMGIPGSKDCIVINNDIYEASRLEVMFIHGLIDMGAYCIGMPITVLPSEAACGIMMRNINYRFESMPQCVDYCSKMIASSKPREDGLNTHVYRLARP